MHPITIIVLVVAITHTITVFVDLRGYSGNYNILQNKLNFWLIIHVMGLTLCGFLFNYELEQVLQSYLRFTRIPVISLLKIFSGLILVLHLFTWIIHKFTVIPIAKWISKVIFIGLIALYLINLLLYNYIPYYQLQLVTLSGVAIVGIITAYGVTPLIKIVLAQEKDPVRLIKFRWFMISQSTAFISMLLILIDGIWKLKQEIMVIYTPLYIAAELLRQWILISHITMNHGNYLTWLNYPVKIIHYRRLKNLSQHIQQQAAKQNYGFDIQLPLPTPRQIDLLILRQYITILDAYSFLPLNSTLRHAIHKINNPDNCYEDTIKILNELSRKYAK